LALSQEFILIDVSFESNGLTYIIFLFYSFPEFQLISFMV